MLYRTIPSATTSAVANAGTPLSYESATMTWTAALYNGGSPITNYETSCDDSTNPPVTQTFAASVCSGSSCTSGPDGVSGLTSGTAYVCSVEATNAVGTSASATATSFTARDWDYAEQVSSTVPAINVFGVSGAIDSLGLTLVMGAPAYSSSGAIYVFTRASAGASWTQVALIPNSAGSGTGFGDAVDISGDGSVIVVGAPISPPTNTGAAYVLERPGGGWSSSVTPIALVPTSYTPATSAYFGRSTSISTDGSTIAIGGESYIFVIKFIAADSFSSSCTAQLTRSRPIPEYSFG